VPVDLGERLGHELPLGRSNCVPSLEERPERAVVDESSVSAKAAIPESGLDDNLHTLADA
jgi:hypothetical protein